MIRIYFTLAMLFLAGCVAGTGGNARLHPEPMIMVMCIDQNGWYRCVAIKRPQGITLEWIISPKGSLSDRDDIRVTKTMSPNEFDALYSIIEKDERLTAWKRTGKGNLTLDNGLLITLRPDGAVSTNSSTFDINPTPESAAVIQELKNILGFEAIQGLGIKK